MRYNCLFTDGARNAWCIATRVRAKNLVLPHPALVHALVHGRTDGTSAAQNEADADEAKKGGGDRKALENSCICDNAALTRVLSGA